MTRTKILGKELTKTFKTKIEAAKAYDILNLIFFPTQSNFNFNPKTYKNINFENFLSNIVRILPLNNKTGFRGVYEYYKKNGESYFLAMTKNNDRKTVNIGSYKSAEKAAKAYDNYLIKNSKRKTLRTLNFLTLADFCNLYKLELDSVKRRIRKLKKELQ